MDKILKLLEIAKKFGVKPSKVIGTQGNVVPYKKPSLVNISVDEFKLKESIDSGAMTMDKVQQEMEETVRLALSKNLNDVELNRALNNAINIERQFFPPVADVVKFGSGEEIKGKGLEQLIKKQGTKNPPTTVAGQLETQGKKLEKAGEDLKEITEPKSVIGDIIKDYGDFDKYMQSSEKTGYVRATVRQIMREDIQAGKLKLPKELQDQVMQGIGEPIDVYRKVYGEGALEQIDSLADDLGKFRTEEEAAKFARSKYTIEPKAKPVDESKTYEELEDILKKGPDEPEGKAQGGIIGYAIGGRIGFNKGKRVLDLIAEANKKLKDKKSMESVDPKTGEVTVPKEPIKTAEEPTGMTTMDPEPEIIDEKSITTTKQQTKSRQLTNDEIADYEEQIGRNAEEWLSEGTVDEAEKALKSSKAEEAYYRREYISGKLNPVPGEKTEDRLNFLRKKFEEASMVKDKKLFGKDELNELLDLEVMYSQKTETPVIKNRALDSFLKVLNTDRLELERIQQKYTGVIDDSFLKEILLDPNPQSRAEIMAQIDESLTMQQKGMSEEEIMDILDKTKRTKQARGGTAGGLDYLMGF